MSWIKPVTYETASPEVKAFLDEKGHEILNSSRKRPYQMLLHLTGYDLD